MGKINFGRVLLGGLVAGVILAVGEWLLNTKVLATQMGEFFKRCGFPMPGNSFLVIFVIITLVLGIVLVLGYAAIRPRFGAGPKTAIMAVGLGMEPANMLPLMLGWELVEYLLAALVGAALYKED